MVLGRVCGIRRGVCCKGGVWCKEGSVVLRSVCSVRRGVWCSEGCVV